MYPAFRDPTFVSSGWAMLGPRGQDACGIIAGMRIGGNLAGLQQNLSYPSTYHIPTNIATRDSYTDMLPGHPTFVFRGSTGILLGENSFEHLIAVNQVGKRFFNDMELVRGWNRRHVSGRTGRRHAACRPRAQAARLAELRARLDPADV